MLHEIILAVIVSFDTFLFAAAYRAGGIRIPIRSACVVNAVGASVLGLAMLFSGFIGTLIPDRICRIAGFVSLVAIGVITVFKSLLRNLVRRLSSRGDLSMKLGSGGIVLRLYLDDTAADLDCSKTLSAPEAVTLALASSLDAAAIGFSCGIGDVSPLFSAVFTFIAGSLAILLGTLAGGWIASLRHDLSWLGGGALICFAFFELLKL